MAVTIENSLCRGCGICAEKCPEEAISMYDVAVVDTERCSECGICVEACPVGAVRTKGGASESDFSRFVQFMGPKREIGRMGRMVHGRRRGMKGERTIRTLVQKGDDVKRNEETLSGLRYRAEALKQKLESIKIRTEELKKKY